MSHDTSSNLSKTRFPCFRLSKWPLHSFVTPKSLASALTLYSQNAHWVCQQDLFIILASPLYLESSISAARHPTPTHPQYFSSFLKECFRLAYGGRVHPSVSSYFVCIHSPPPLPSTTDSLLFFFLFCHLPKISSSHEVHLSRCDV